MTYTLRMQEVHIRTLIFIGFLWRLAHVFLFARALQHIIEKLVKAVIKNLCGVACIETHYFRF